MVRLSFFWNGINFILTAVSFFCKCSSSRPLCIKGPWFVTSTCTRIFVKGLNVTPIYATTASCVIILCHWRFLNVGKTYLRGFDGNVATSCKFLKANALKFSANYVYIYIYIYMPLKSGVDRSQATIFCTVDPNVCGSSIWNLLSVTLLVPRSLRSILLSGCFLEFVHPCHTFCWCQVEDSNSAPARSLSLAIPLITAAESWKSKENGLYFCIEMHSKNG